VNLLEQATYNLAKNRTVIGGSNLNICDKSLGFTSTLELDKKYKRLKVDCETSGKLYHLLTENETFFISGIKFYDYNSCIDLFLEKYRGKLLSMKYV
jgi:ssDNA-binding Zn-finger/Zn-ribbon topoisomerase 1